MVRRYSFLCGSLALLLLTGTARALDNPEVFGTDEEGITVVGWQDFFPFQSDLPYGGSIERYGSSTMYAGLNMLPNGSLITQLTFYVRDDDAGSNFQGALCHSAVTPRTARAMDRGASPPSAPPASRAKTWFSRTTIRRCPFSIGRSTATPRTW